MSEPKRFRRGKHSYTRWGTNFKEVRVEKDAPAPPPPSAPAAEVTLDLDPTVENGVYSNFTMLHTSPDEVMLDFCYLPPGKKRGRVRSRVILSHQQAKDLAELLSQGK